jgi:RNA polymerase sigma-54 factor
MALEQKLALKLAQKLVMTPSLQQAIKLLQMTRIELEGAVTAELEQNPLLEENASSDFRMDSIPSDSASKSLGEEAPSPSVGEEFDPASLYDHADNYSLGSSGLGGESEHGEFQPFERIAARSGGLVDHLEWQLMMLDLDERTKEVCRSVIGNLDEDGFLCATGEEMASLIDERCTPEEVEAALAVVRELDPVGVAYPDLKSSLLRQIQEHADHECFPAAETLIRDHWQALLQKRFDQIIRLTGLRNDEIQRAVELISHLEIRPGRRFNNESAQYIEPDVYVIKVGGDYVVQLNENGLPRLRVSRFYSKMLRDGGGDREADQYIREKMRSAIWLIRSIDQRQRTIYKVASSIVLQQKAFLDFGVEAMRPMVLRDVAEDIGMHESTVSRVVSNKYIHTPQGILPMKFFFHSKIDRDSGDDISSLSVKQKIKQLISDENPSKPLSDSDLSASFKKDGINIARRTIAKYRDELGIPSSSDRRRLTQARS